MSAELSIHARTEYGHPLEEVKVGNFPNFTTLKLNYGEIIVTIFLDNVAAIQELADAIHVEVAGLLIASESPFNQSGE